MTANVFKKRNSDYSDAILSHYFYNKTWTRYLNVWTIGFNVS